MLSTIGFKRLNEQASFICAAHRRSARDFEEIRRADRGGSPGPRGSGAGVFWASGAQRRGENHDTAHDLFGMDISQHLRAVRARLGVTLQQNVLIESLSPKENLLVFGRYHLLREPDLSRRAEELIEPDGR